MAVAYQTISTLAFASRTSADDMVITKPTGLAVGDLMIAILRIGQETTTVTPPASWTSIVSVAPGSYYITSYWKIADAGDVAASNFTFEISSTNICAAVMYRIDGHSSSSPINTSGGTNASNTATPSFAAGITPTVASCLLIMAVVNTNASDAPNTISGYAIATSNPTWTERADFQDSGSVLATATSIRPQTTATGNFSCTQDGGDTTNSWRGIIIAVSPVVSAIKTVNGLAKASVKTVNGLAIASVKTINGLA